jgi:hypothetical protein
MSKQNELWIVVDVRSGIPVSVNAFTDEKTANDLQRDLQTQINPENDEVGLFFIHVDDIHHTYH